MKRKLKRKKLSYNMKKFVRHMEDYYDKQMELPPEKRNIFTTSTEPQLVVDCLTDLILGEDWYTPDPITVGQVNTIILDNILYDYCKEYRKIADKKIHGKELDVIIGEKKEKAEEWKKEEENE